MTSLSLRRFVRSTATPVSGESPEINAPFPETRRSLGSRPDGQSVLAQLYYRVDTLTDIIENDLAA